MDLLDSYIPITCIVAFLGFLFMCCVETYMKPGTGSNYDYSDARIKTCPEWKITQGSSGEGNLENEQFSNSQRTFKNQYIPTPDKAPMKLRCEGSHIPSDIRIVKTTSAKRNWDYSYVSMENRSEWRSTLGSSDEDDFEIDPHETFKDRHIVTADEEPINIKGWYRLIYQRQLEYRHKNTFIIIPYEGCELFGDWINNDKYKSYAPLWIFDFKRNKYGQRHDLIYQGTAYVIVKCDQDVLPVHFVKYKKHNL